MNASKARPFGDLLADFRRFDASTTGARRAFFALFSNVVGQTFLLAVLPPMGHRLGFSDIETASILSVSALVMIVAAPAWGYLSERIGRRPVLLAGLAGAGLGPCAFGAIVDLRLGEAIHAGTPDGAGLRGIPLRSRPRPWRARASRR